MVLLDNQTRWNSQYLSISQALKVKERIVIFQTRYPKEVGKNSLTDEDWSHLTKLKAALWPFLNITNKIQGQQGSLWQWLPGIEGIYFELERQIERFKENGESSRLAKCSDAAWKKLEEYYSYTDDAYHLYAAAVLFNPEQRMQYFDRNWNTPKLERHKKQMLTRVRKEWTQFYKPKTTPKAKNTTPSDEDTDVDIFDRQMGRISTISMNSKDPLTEFVMDAPDKLLESTTESYLAWWDKNGHPDLKQMAFDSLSLPATSCDLERVFSDAGDLIQPRMNSMTPKTLEIRVCLQQWLRRGVIEIQNI